MAIDFNAPTTAPAAADNAKARPVSKLWLNLGAYMDVQAEDGTVTKEFISLPLGIGLDTMEPMKGNSILAKRKNALLDMLQKSVKNGVKPGEQEVIHGLVIQASHLSPDAAAIPESVQESVANIKISFG